VYRVDSFQVPVAGQNEHSTLVTGLPAYFVTNDRLNFYFYRPMENDQATAHPKLLYIADNRFFFVHFTELVFLLLFMNDVTRVHNLFFFALHQNFLQPAVHFLFNSRILLTNVSSLLLTCGSQDKNLTRCLICMLQIPCNCRVKLFLQNSSLPNFFGHPN